MWPFAPSLLTSHAPSEENTWTVLDAISLFLFYSTIGVQARRGRPMQFLLRNPHPSNNRSMISPSAQTEFPESGIPAGRIVRQTQRLLQIRKYRKFQNRRIEPCPSKHRRLGVDRKSEMSG